MPIGNWGPASCRLASYFRSSADPSSHTHFQLRNPRYIETVSGTVLEKQCCAFDVKVKICNLQSIFARKHASQTQVDCRKPTCVQFATKAAQAAGHAVIVQSHALQLCLRNLQQRSPTASRLLPIYRPRRMDGLVDSTHPGGWTWVRQTRGPHNYTTTANIQVKPTSLKLSVRYTLIRVSIRFSVYKESHRVAYDIRFICHWCLVDISKLSVSQWDFSW
jgi:hypothetical protein